MAIKVNLVRTSCLILIGAIMAGCNSGGSGNNATTQPVYTILFDAGSSGTRLSLYKVIPGNGGYPQITKLSEKEYNDNGINDFLNGNGTIELVDKTGVNTLPGGTRPINCTGGTEQTNGKQVQIVGLGESDVSPCVLTPLLNSQDSTLIANGLTRSQVKTELFATAGMRTEDTRNGGSYSTESIAAYLSTLHF